MPEERGAARPLPSSAGAVGAGVEGKRDAACGAQISAVYLPPDAAGRAAAAPGRRKHRTINVPTAASPGVRAVTPPPPQPGHPNGEAQVRDTVIGTTWKEWPFAGCCVPKTR